MANNNKHTGPNVPSLRFPEFSGEWENICLGDISENISSGKTKSTTKEGKYVLIGSTGVIGNTSDADYSGNLILVARVGANAGLINYYSGDCGITDNTLVIKPLEQEKKFCHYVYHYLKHCNLNQFVFGSGQPLITGGMLKRLPIRYGTKDEINKVSSLFDLLEARIETQSKIIEELTTLRSALYDSMFCPPEQDTPNFRIISFSGKWQLCQLNEICSRKTIKNKEHLYSRVLTIAAQHGLVDQESFFKKRIASENLESYLCLEKGDFAYNKSYSSDHPWGAVKRLSNFENGIISPLYICFTPNHEVIDTDYLAHYFESTKWHSGISDISGEGARNHGLLNMSIVDYFNTLHRIPCLDEQKAIARRLNAIACKLQTEQEYQELLIRQKDYLLKQMFI